MSSFKNIYKLCRLCALEIEYGFDIFVESDVKASLVILINKYLPIKVTEDEFLPKQICESCHIGVAATVDLIDRMVEGQHRLRKLYQQYKRDQKLSKIKLETYSNSHLSERGKTMAGTTAIENFFGDSEGKEEERHTLINIQGNESDIEMDDLAKGTEVKKVYNSHPLGLAMEGIAMNRQRGRPRKGRESIGLRASFLSLNNRSSDSIEVRPKRKKKLPFRFRDAVAGKELDRALSTDDAVKEEPLDKDLSTEVSNSLSRTHTLDGNTVIVTANDFMEDPCQLPDAVNIELSFHEDSTVNEERGGNEIRKMMNTLRVSVSSIKEENHTTKGNPVNQLSRSGRSKRIFSRKKLKYFCEFCNKGFLYVSRYLIHLNLHKNVTLQCDDCKKRFTCREDIDIHQESTKHQGIGLLEAISEGDLCIQCPSCPDKTFSTHERYKRHVANMHEGQKPFACSECDKRYAYKHSLATHKLIHQPQEDQKKFVCRICNREFRFQSSLVYHTESCHTNERKFICVYCGCSFKHKQLLQRHHLVHSDERPFSCQICGSSFKTRGNLQTHMNSHTKAKVYACEICSKKFSQMNSLQLHLRSHTGEKPFSCSFCGKNFSQNGNLQEHIRIHTGVKPYSCSFCSKKFTTSSQLSLHEKRHKGEYKFKCSVCSKGFFSKEIHLMHERKHKSTTVTPATSAPTSTPAIASAFQKSQPSKAAKLENNSELKVCEICNQIFEGCISLSKHMESHHQVEKSWLIEAPPVLDSSNFSQPTSQEILYVIPKKEESSNFELIPFHTDEILEEPLRETLPSISLVGSSGAAMQTNFPLPQSTTAQSIHEGEKIACQGQNQVDVVGRGFEISIKDPSATANSFNLAPCSGPSLYLRKSFDSTME